jgi:hypothetical protein
VHDGVIVDDVVGVIDELNEGVDERVGVGVELDVIVPEGESESERVELLVWI